jgi:hypothetical protein
LAEGFQRRRLKCEKLTDDRRQVMAKKARWAKNVCIIMNSFNLNNLSHLLNKCG